jgi:hypothetical protein
MESHGSLQQVIIRTGRSRGSGRQESPARAALARPMHGIAVLAFLLATLGAASPGHGSAGHVRASAHRPAHGAALLAGAGPMRSGNIVTNPWMYAAVRNPWMYHSVRNPWMYAPPA